MDSDEDLGDRDFQSKRSKTGNILDVDDDVSSHLGSQYTAKHRLLLREDELRIFTGMIIAVYMCSPNEETVGQILGVLCSSRGPHGNAIQVVTSDYMYLFIGHALAKLHPEPSILRFVTDTNWTGTLGMLGYYRVLCILCYLIPDRTFDGDIKQDEGAYSFLLTMVTYVFRTSPAVQSIPKDFYLCRVKQIDCGAKLLKWSAPEVKTQFAELLKTYLTDPDERVCRACASYLPKLFGVFKKHMNVYCGMTAHIKVSGCLYEEEEGMERRRERDKAMRRIDVDCEVMCAMGGAASADVARRAIADIMLYCCWRLLVVRENKLVVIQDINGIMWRSLKSVAHSQSYSKLSQLLNDHIQYILFQWLLRGVHNEINSSLPNNVTVPFHDMVGEVVTVALKGICSASEIEVASSQYLRHECVTLRVLEKLLVPV
eukprot:gene10487-13454_t